MTSKQEQVHGFSKIELEAGHVYLHGVAIALLAFAAGFCVVEMLLKFRADPVFVIQVGWIAVMLSPLLGYIIIDAILKHARRKRTRGKRVAGIVEIVDASVFKFNYVVLVKDRLVEKTLHGAEAVAVTVLSCTFFNLLINVIANLPFRLQVLPIDKYLFYAAIAVAEEVTFRITPVNIILAIFDRFETTRHSRATVIFAAIVSGLIFSAAHWTVYHAVPRMMWATGIAGFMMACFYGFTKNPLVNIVAHLVNNLIAAMFVFTAAIMIVV
nr:CPBP family intramembrane metalloprotease [Candidatus Sigynarchaeota archaeon]